MKTVALFGAGRSEPWYRACSARAAVRAALRITPRKSGEASLPGIPIVSPRDALLFDPDAVCICVLDDERAAQMCSQLDALGYDGEIISRLCLKPSTQEARRCALLPSR